VPFRNVPSQRAALLEKLLVVKILKKLFSFPGKRKFVKALIEASSGQVHLAHTILPWLSWMLLKIIHPSTSWSS
jgi:hypothetical protein